MVGDITLKEYLYTLTLALFWKAMSHLHTRLQALRTKRTNNDFSVWELQDCRREKHVVTAVAVPFNLHRMGRHPPCQLYARR